MYWEDLDKDNIDLAKAFYYDYLRDNKDKYSNQILGFEEFLQNEVTKCDRCGNWTLMNHMREFGGYLCECCYDDLYYPEERDYYDEYIDRKLEEGARNG